MLLNTKYFGEIEVESSNLLDFKLLIFGFEDHKQFAPITDTGIGEGIILLQSVNSADLCFVLTDARIVADNYAPNISSNTHALLESNNITEASYWFITVIGHEFKDSTVNMKSPVLIDFESKSAAQIIMDEDLPLRAPLVLFQKEA